MARKRPGGGLSSVQQAVKFLGVSVLSGAVLAGLALPAVGALGLAARGTMEGFDEIPEMMERPPLSQKTTILDAEGNKIADVYSRNRTVVPLDEMSDHMRQAIVAIEDARFYEHGAVDLRGLLRAVTRNVEEGSVTEGGSTLTMQYVKNVFVEAAGDDAEAVAEATDQSGADGFGRKIREIKYAIQVEQELTKDQILENYLNITFFGQQAYGVEAAAQRYFSKPAAELELHEAAMLAGLVQSPYAYEPISNPEAAVERRNTVLQKMVESEDITQAEADEAKALDLGLDISEPRSGCITAVNDAGFFCDYVKEEFLASREFGETVDEREARWALGGLTIQTTLDPQAQAAAAQAARDHIDVSDPVAASVVQVQPGTGHILSMAQSRPYGTNAEEHQTMLNLTAPSSMGGTPGFQPGSTFKPFTAAAALEAGISPAQSFTTEHEIEVDQGDFRDCENVPLGDARTEPYTVPNEQETQEGTWDMTSALGQSINTYFVLLERQVGMCDTVTMAGELGVVLGSGEPLNDRVVSTTLGTQLTAPLAMANAYATFANRGVYCAPVAITAVTDADGEELAVPEPECERVMSEHTADSMNVMLGGVVEEGSGASVGLTDRDNAGKTGTTDDRKDVWFVGYTPDLATAVHVGDDQGERQAMVDITLGGQYYERASGARVAGPIWNQAMTGALADVPPSSFNPVDVPRGNEDPDRPGDDDDRPGGNRPGGGGDDDGGNGDDGEGSTNFGEWPDFEWPDNPLGGTSDGTGNGNQGTGGPQQGTGGPR